MKKLTIAIIIAAASSSGMAQQSIKNQSQNLDQPSWYMGIGGGQSRVSQSGEPWTTPPSSETFDDRGNNVKVFLGYRFDRNWRLEGGYHALGRSTNEAYWSSNGDTFNREYKDSGWFLDARLGGYIENAYIYGKLGGMYAQTDVSWAGTGTRAGFAGTAKDSQWVPRFGLGAEFDVDRSIGLRLEWERTNTLGNKTNLAAGWNWMSRSSPQHDINMLNVGITFKFN